MSDRAPRRVPRQERSRETVAAIVEATDRLLRGSSTEKLTMRAVAKMSGVSMGSLYQYFGTREALLAGWEEHAFGRIWQRIVAVIARLVESPPCMEVGIFTVAMAAIEACEHHMSAYPSTDAFFFSRVRERHQLKEGAAEAIVMALESSTDRDRIRPLDRMAAARTAVMTVPQFSRVLANSALAAEDKEAVRRQLASMIVFLFVKEVDESMLHVDEAARAAGRQSASTLG